MAQQPTQHPQQHRDELNRAGIDTQHHDRLLAIRQEAVSRGLDWSKILDAVKQYGPIALQILEQLLGGGGAQTQSQAQPGRKP